MDTTVTIRNERSSWLVQISAPRAEHDRILVALGAVVGAYYRADEGIYRVAGHRELVLRRFAEQVRERGAVSPGAGNGMRIEEGVGSVERLRRGPVSPHLGRTVQGCSWVRRRSGRLKAGAVLYSVYGAPVDAVLGV